MPHICSLGPNSGQSLHTVIVHINNWIFFCVLTNSEVKCLAICSAERIRAFLCMSLHLQANTIFYRGTITHSQLPLLQITINCKVYIFLFCFAFPTTVPNKKDTSAQCVQCLFWLACEWEWWWHMHWLNDTFFPKRRVCLKNKQNHVLN